MPREAGVSRIHPTALVDPAAELAADVEVGAFSIVGPHVRIGAGTVIGPHAVVTGRTTIGERNRIFQFSSIGEIPQDRKYGGEPTTTVIGDDNVIREYVSIHAGTALDLGTTTIGNGNLVLAYVHIAHDCVIGDGTTFSNSSQLAGHVVVGDWAVFGGVAAVHQFVRDRRPRVHRWRVDPGAGRSAVRHGEGLSGGAPRHQQRRAAPARILRRGHRRGPPRLQDALPRGPLARGCEGGAGDGRGDVAPC